MDSGLDNIDAVFLDLDGTIYLGGELIPGALEFLKRCDEKGVKDTFFQTTQVVQFNNMLRSCTALRFRLS